MQGTLITLRPLTIADAAKLAQWKSDPAIDPVSAQRPTTTAAERRWIRRVLSSRDGAIHFAIDARADDRMIGFASVWLFGPSDAKATLNVFIGERTVWGKGFGTEAVTLLVRHAFLSLRAHRVELEVLASNARAIGLYERLGFHREGRLRESVLLRDRYEDVVIMSILQDEWHDREALRHAA